MDHFKKQNLPEIDSFTVAILGLGYVGLNLAVTILKKNKLKKNKYISQRKVIGFDKNIKRLNQLKNRFDKNYDINKNDLVILDNIEYTNKFQLIASADIFIITVPTPVDKEYKPDLSYVKDATRQVAKALIVRAQNSRTKIKPVVIFESTVFPGVTEEICIPIIEKESKLLIRNKSFYYGYSPERVNPGDKVNTISNTIKVTSGSNKNIAKWISKFYSSFIKNETYSAHNIKTAEAAKLIENIQRDVNIALINEFVMICSKLGISSYDVLKAASTKWNFLNFKPGLVGGHCIGVDSYYLINKLLEEGYYPKIISIAREVNESMASWIFDRIILELAKVDKLIKDSKILIMGFAFKDNCSDIRNTKIYELVKLIKNQNLKFEIFDPKVNINEVKEKYKLKLLNSLNGNNSYDVVIVLLSHNDFIKMKLKDWKSLIKKDGIFIDFKGFLHPKLNPVRF